MAPSGTSGTGVAYKVRVASGHVFVTGSVGRYPGEDLRMRAYDAATGVLEWEDRYDKAQGWDRGIDLAVDGSRVFVVGAATGGAGGTDFLIRACEGF